MEPNLEEILISLELSYVAGNEFMKNSVQASGATYKIEKYMYDRSVLAHGYVFSKDDTMYVAFSGTYNKPDLFAEIDHKLAKPDFLLDVLDVCVHETFLAQFNAVKEQLANCLQVHKFSHIVFCGHSQGGAVATLAAAWFDSINKEAEMTMKLHTFGTPRIGNQIFNNHFKVLNFPLEHWRVCCVGDPVPNEPEYPTFCHVSHGCKMLTLDLESHSTSALADNGEFEWTITFFSKWAYHSVWTYRPRLDAAIKRHKDSISVPPEENRA